MTFTHTYAVLGVSLATYTEVAERLRSAGYATAIDDTTRLVDMHGLALGVAEPGEALISNAGRVGYEAYSKAAGGKSLVSGEPLFDWTELPAAIREAWNAAAEAIRRS